MRPQQAAIGPWLAIMLLVVLAGGCGTSSDGEPLPAASIGSAEDSSLTLEGIPNAEQVIANPGLLPPPTRQQNLHPEVLISTSEGDIRVRLDAEHAPETVDNFLANYVKRDFYSGTIFHYVESGFIIIGGGYSEDLDPKRTRAPIRNEAANGLENKRGTIAMSRQVDYTDSATSQFFFNLADNKALDHDPDGGDEGYGYCVFGNVVQGMDVLEKMAAAKVGDQGEFQKLPVSPVVIESIREIE